MRWIANTLPPHARAKARAANLTLTGLDPSPACQHIWYPWRHIKWAVNGGIYTINAPFHCMRPHGAGEIEFTDLVDPSLTMHALIGLYPIFSPMSGLAGVASWLEASTGEVVERKPDIPGGMLVFMAWVDFAGKSSYEQNAYADKWDTGKVKALCAYLESRVPEMIPDAPFSIIFDGSGTYIRGGSGGGGGVKRQIRRPQWLTMGASGGGVGGFLPEGLGNGDGWRSQIGRYIRDTYTGYRRMNALLFSTSYYNAWDARAHWWRPPGTYKGFIRYINDSGYSFSSDCIIANQGNGCYFGPYSSDSGPAYCLSRDGITLDEDAGYEMDYQPLIKPRQLIAEGTNAPCMCFSWDCPILMEDFKACFTNGLYGLIDLSNSSVTSERLVCDTAGRDFDPSQLNITDWGWAPYV